MVPLGILYGYWLDYWRTPYSDCNQLFDMILDQYYRGFTYVWEDMKRGMFLYGCHWGRVDDGHICYNRRFRVRYIHRPHTFKRTVLEKFRTRVAMWDAYQKLLDSIPDDELYTVYYNTSKKVKRYWTYWPKEEYDKVIKKIKENTSEAMNLPWYEHMLFKKGNYYGKSRESGEVLQAPKRNGRRGRKASTE